MERSIKIVVAYAATVINKQLLLNAFLMISQLLSAPNKFQSIFEDLVFPSSFLPCFLSLVHRNKDNFL